MHTIEPSTIQAYLETDYCVFGRMPFVLRVGIASESLARLYRQYAASSGAFITACNPHGLIASEEANAACQAELAGELQRRCLDYIEGMGRHPHGDWPAEPSYFVLGLSLEEARLLGKKYRQNAIVWCGVDAVPELVMLV
ncbi:MAG: DUF3293 domain-containing protein [Gallionella sp.]